MSKKKAAETYVHPKISARKDFKKSARIIGGRKPSTRDNTAIAAVFLNALVNALPVNS